MIVSKPSQFGTILFADHWYRTRCASCTGLGKGFPVRAESPLHQCFLTAAGGLFDNFDALAPTNAEALSTGVCGFLAPVLGEEIESRTKGFQNHHDFLRACVLEARQADLGNADAKLRDVAERAGVSYRLLNELFREVGTTPHAKWMDLRFERAAVELRSSENQALSVSEIGERSGFRNASHFGKCFKAKYGLTPNEWKQRR